MLHYYAKGFINLEHFLFTTASEKCKCPVGQEETKLNHECMREPADFPFALFHVLTSRNPHAVSRHACTVGCAE